MKHRLEHIVCQTPTDRNSCRGSKYIQSHIDKNIYRTLEDELKKGTPLLYIGMPCQVAAIKQYISVKHLNVDSMITCDILCHGVGSPGIWSKFLEINSEFDYVTFKDKRDGWMNPRCIARSGDKEVSLRGYSWLYFADAIMRPACYECRYSNIDRVGDVTIGDFRKAKDRASDIFNPRGTSFVMVNSDKGLSFFEDVKKHLEYKEVVLDDIIQNNMRRPTKKTYYHDEVMRDFRKVQEGNMRTRRFFRKWQTKLLIGKIIKKITP